MTARNIEPDDPCVGWDIIENHEARLLYISDDQSPHLHYYSVPVVSALANLRFLQLLSQESDAP